MAEATAPSLMTVALKGVCPRCGAGKLFSGFMNVAPFCPVCGLSLAEHDSGDGPAVFLIFILGFLVIPLAVVVAFQTDWPVWLHALLWGGVLTLCTVGLLRPAKALTVALQYRHRSTSKTL